MHTAISPKKKGRKKNQVVSLFRGTGEERKEGKGEALRFGGSSPPFLNYSTIGCWGGGRKSQLNLGGKRRKKN